MGKPTGFMEYERDLGEDRDPLERVKDWDEFHLPLVAGDLVAICSAGAYGAVMASTYNARPLAPEVLVKGADFKVVRERMGWEEMFNRNLMPDWLEHSKD